MFNTCGDFESGYCTPHLVHLQYNNRTYTDGQWKKVGGVFGHKELIDEITKDNNKRTNILLTVSSQRLTPLPVRRQTQAVVKHSCSITLRGCGQQNKRRRH